MTLTFVEDPTLIDAPAPVAPQAAIPPKLVARLKAFCELADEDPLDVLVDALELHLDALGEQIGERDL